ncbi:glutamate transport system permease protein [Streptomyces sp. SLBN-118]|uniref:amino acid ABC transporter permease n=1 Tax=Streptomyces sp. SLBN-118 TaxID=2768454 RepID=UPI00114EF4B1|nr:amino acid ABC transporter permease [Streptomyces sp. SLBN-118]TQK51448.1 glutamate transport system permease protein [Streptomyces sp. SLBN-118]
MTSVLYDAPGPRAKRRNIIYTIVFLVALGLAIWWALSVMADKDQLTADKWKPFVTDSQVWTTYLLPGLWLTVKAAFFAIVIALPLGALLGIGRLSDHRWIRVPAGAVVEFFRAIPVLILMFFASALFVQFTDIESEIRPMYAVVTGLVLYNASVIAEIVRAGVLSLPQGQTDAAKAVGMRKGQILSHVLLPQAVTAMLPALVSQLVVIVKDTALGGALLGLAELLSQARTIPANYGANTIATLTVISLIFIALNYLLTTLASWLEGRARRTKKGTGAVLGAEEVDELNVPHAGEEAGGGGAES